jgi:hypothetical protein
MSRIITLVCLCAAVFAAPTAVAETLKESIAADYDVRLESLFK